MLHQVVLDIGCSQEALVAVWTLVRVDAPVAVHVVMHSLLAGHLLTAQVALEHLTRAMLAPWGRRWISSLKTGHSNSARTSQDAHFLNVQNLYVITS